MRYVFAEGTVLVEGPSYDLVRVGDACHHLIARLAAKYGPGVSVAIEAPVGVMPPVPHKDPAIFTRSFWEACAQRYDVNIDASIEFGVGPVTAKANLLGRTWCVFHEGKLFTAEGKPASEIDPVPTLCVFGQRHKGLYRMPAPTIIADVEKHLSREIRSLGLVFEKSEVIRLPTKPPSEAQVAFISFPHAVYGRGRDWLRVRCTMADGSPVSPSDEGQ